MRRMVVGMVALSLAACGSGDQDKLPDDLTSAEGVETPEIVLNEPEPVAEPEPEPDPAADRSPDNGDGGAPPPVATAQPSFPCNGRLSRVEALVCTSPELATLDRQLARTYERAMSEADEDQAERLRRLGTRYIADRDRCETTACVAQAYRWYRRDVELVMGWQSP
jgi:hypothetical protein